MTLFALGLNHITAPIEVREKVVVSGESLPGVLGELSEQKGIDEVAILSTCNRTEIYCSLNEMDSSVVVDWFTHFHHLKMQELNPFIYSYPDDIAVKHMLRVASGLDSMVLGEPQVLGQLKSAYKVAVKAGSIGQLLGRLFQHSFKVAKEIRSNTEIGNHPVSIAYAAVRLGQQIFGDFNNKTALLIGAGETINLTARHLHESGLSRMIFANRTLERSQQLASEYSGYIITMNDIENHLNEADIVITATASPVPIISKKMIENAVIKRKHRPIYIVDIAVPRDVDPTVAELEDVYHYTIDDLQGVIEENLRNREQAAMQAEEIIETQVIHFMDWMNSLNTVSTIKAIREQAEILQHEVVEAAIKKLKLGENPEKIVKELARSLSNKLIHSPSSNLRNISNEQKDDILRAARLLFDVPGDPGSTNNKK
jgi:glutamyl-tRNA reductase